MAVTLLQETREGPEKAIAMVILLRAGSEACTYKTCYDETLSISSPGIHVLMEATRIILSMGDIARMDSCAKADHPVADKLWPQRRAMADILIPARDLQTRHMVKTARWGADAFSRIRAVLRG